jgi:hypothetical protein
MEPLPAHRTAQIQIKRAQVSMPQVGFEPAFPVFEREEDSSCLRPRGYCDRLVLDYRHMKQAVKNTVFWNITPCSLLKVFFRFEEPVR